MVGLLTVLGQNNDQLVLFFAILSAATVAGIIASALTINFERLAQPVMLAVALVAVAAYADSHSTSLTRAPQLYATQALIAFATTFFLGPSLLFGMTRALAQGTAHVVSFLALFGIVNSIGGLAGSALIGSYQIVREKADSSAIVQGISPADPIVQQRLQSGAAGIARVVGDPALRQGGGCSAAGPGRHARGERARL